MKPKLGILDKYRPLWEGGKSVEKYNIKVGFKIRMFVVSQITSKRQKNPNALNQKDIEQLTDMIKELKEDKATIPVEEQTCTLEDYQKFLSDFFNKVDYEDRHDTVTIKTTSKFRLMASFIDVLSTWGPIDEEMVKCKKYCQFKAVDIFKALKNGQIPKRGGPKEQLDDNNENNKNETDININENKNHLKQNNTQSNQNPNKISNLRNNKNNIESNKNYNNGNSINNQANKINNNKINHNNDSNYNQKNQINNNIKRDNGNYNYNNKNNNHKSYGENLDKKENLNYTNPNINYKQQFQKDPRAQKKINFEQKNDLMNKTEINNNFQKFQSHNVNYKLNKNDNNFQNNNQNLNNNNYKKLNNLQINSNNKLKANNHTSFNPNYSNNYHKDKNNNNKNLNYKRKSLVFPSQDGNQKKRTFKGKYKLTTYIPVKYNTVPYFMLIENVRINNDNALKALKRGKAENVLNLVLDSLDFLTYVHK